MIPNELKQEGINFVLLERSGKKPFQKDWQHKIISYDNNELIQHINSNGNYGVRGGGKNNLIIIDFDNQELQDKLLPLLPKTFTVKTGSGLLHLYYFSDKSKSFKIFDEEMNTLADIQGEGKQVVGANSTHPNGNKYEVVRSIPISNINYAEIKAMFMKYDKKPKKEKKVFEKPLVNLSDDFIDRLKSSISIEDVLSAFGVDTSHNPTGCPFHSSKGGKCLGFNNETAHCFHCDGSWNIFSLVKDYKKCDFKEALEFLADLAGLQNELKESRKKYYDSLRNEERNEKETLKAEFLDLISGRVKRIAEATELLVNYILDKNHIYTTKDDNKSEIWVYEDGIYTPNGKCFIKEIMGDILGQWFNIYYFNLVMNKIETRTYINPNKFFNNNYVYEVPVKNGILNILTKELNEFTPDKIFFNKLPVEYNPLCDCPQINNFLKEVLAKKEDINVFYEIGGYCLLKEYKFEKAFMFIGDGRNGKDKSLELIKRLIGIDNCCSVPLSSILPDSFILSEFFGRMVNIAGDINNHDLKDTSTFKALTGRSLMSAQRKFLNPINFVNYSKFIFACNDLPMVYDTSKGFWDRWVLLEFPYTFVTKEELDKDNKNLKLRDENIIEKITTDEELSGFLNKCLSHLDILLKSKTFSSTLGSQEIKDMWIRKSNSVMAFAMEKVEENYDDFITKKQFRKKYVEFCKKYKIKVKSDYVIKRTLEEEYGVVPESRAIFDSKYENVWSGIKWLF